MTDPSFSVVIPVFNGARYIARSVASALGQQGVRHEVIVVDDGSADGSGDLVAALGPAVRLIRHESNRGLPAARNTGIRAARGERIAFLDSDDWWAADKLAAQGALFDAAPELGTVFCDFAGVDLGGRASGWQGGLVDQLPRFGLDLAPVCTGGYRLGGSVTHALIRHSSFMHPSTVVVRRELFGAAGLFDEGMKYVEDLDMWLRLAAAGPVGLTGRVLATVEYRPTSHGRQRVNMDEHIVRLFAALPERFPDLPPDLRAHVGRVLESTHLGLGWRYRTAGDVGAARGHYRAALRYGVRARTLLALLRTYLPAALR